MEATMKRPETVALTYDKSNPMAKKTLNFILSLGLFQIEKITKSQIESKHPVNPIRAVDIFWIPTV